MTSDGYRAIKSLVVATNGLSVTATFASPYADWELLFRDIEAPGTTPGCAIGNLVSRPSLGPYSVSKATASRIVLSMNPQWPLDPNRFGRIVITDNQNLPASFNSNYADYTLALDSASIVALSNHPTLDSHIGSSNNIEELTFAPGTPITSQLALRKALSLSISRQSMIDTLFGSVTYSPSVAASAIYSQGQSQYPGTVGLESRRPDDHHHDAREGQSGGLRDLCARRSAASAGYTRTSAGWIDGSAKPLTIVLGVGSSVLDHSVAKLVVADWKVDWHPHRDRERDVRRGGRARGLDGQRRRGVVRATDRDQPVVRRSLVGGPAVPGHLSQWRAYRERDNTLWRRGIDLQSRHRNSDVAAA